MIERLQSLKQHMRTARNDATRYRVAETIRELGYIDFDDFYGAKPLPAHVAAVEQAINSLG